MWRLNCGCGEVSEPFESKIDKKTIISSNLDFILPYSTDRSDCLSEKII